MIAFLDDSNEMVCEEIISSTELVDQNETQPSSSESCSESLECSDNVMFEKEASLACSPFAWFTRNEPNRGDSEIDVVTSDDDSTTSCTGPQDPSPDVLAINTKGIKDLGRTISSKSIFRLGYDHGYHSQAFYKNTLHPNLRHTQVRQSGSALTGSNPGRNFEMSSKSDLAVKIVRNFYLLMYPASF